MNTMTDLVEIRGARLRVGFLVSTYVHAWKQRPAGPALGGFTSIDNSTGVSDVEYRPR